MVNDPVAVRNAPEKLLVTHFPSLAPPTLITADKREIAAFRAEQGDIVLKPLFGNGGAGVFHVKPDDDNFNAMLEMYAQRSREPIVAQRYLPQVRQRQAHHLDRGRSRGRGQPRAAGRRGPFQHACRWARRKPPLLRANAKSAPPSGRRCASSACCSRDRRDRRISHRDQRDLATGIQEIDRFDGTMSALIWDAIERKRS